MFELSLLDHLRLTFGHVVSRHKAHTRIALSRARWSRWIKAAEAVFITGVALAATCAVFGRGQAYEIVSAILAGLALVTLLLHLAVDFDGTARAHAACATRLWHVREKYRTLLSDLADGAIGLDAARERRDVLMHEVHGIYEHALLADQQAYQGVAQTIPMVDEGTVTDEEIDRLLPQSFRKASSPTAH